MFGAGFLSRKDQGELFREEAEQDVQVQAEEQDQPQEVIVINVMARPGRMFEGYDLLPILQLQGLRLGEMSIFHKHSGSNGSGSVLFSMANMVKPGTFDLASMDSFATPGVSFFLQLPNRYGNMAAFELMLTAANAIKHALDGELKDENRSVMTRQTLEHYKQRIRDFELSLLTRR
jgi:cell division protein ZipA